MKTILFVETGSGYGGSAVCLASMTEHLDRTAYRPIVAYYHEGMGIERMRQQGIPLVPLHRGRAWWELVHLIRRERVELVHGNNDLYSHIASVLAAGWTHRPYLMHMRGIRPLTRVERWLIRRIMHFIVLSNVGRAFYVEEGMPAERITMIHDALDLTVFNDHLDGRAVRRSLGIPDDAVVVGIVSRLVPKKGHRDLLYAVAQLSRDLPQVRCVVVGGDPRPREGYLKELKALACTLQIQERVIFTGWRNDIPALTSSFDIAVQVSEYLEGFGTSILEAMALGKPVVATAVGAVPEVVEDGKTGRLVPPANLDALTAELRALIMDRALREQYGLAGRERVERLFDQRVQAKAIEALYVRLLMDPSTRAPAMAGGPCSGCRPEGTRVSGAPGTSGGLHGARP